MNMNTSWSIAVLLPLFTLFHAANIRCKRLYHFINGDNKAQARIAVTVTVPVQ